MEMNPRIWIAVGAALVLGAVNFSILGKERIKSNGEVVYLEIAPIDPRSIMQGDYMALRFRLAQQIQERVKPLPDEGMTGDAEIVLDQKRVANLALGAPSKLKIRYRIRNGAVWLGTNAFFFEEGTGDRYARARYGEFRVDRDSGEAVLVGLRDTLGP
jgi:uncharacterized membrane-anchored protein